MRKPSIFYLRESHRRDEPTAGSSLSDPRRYKRRMLDTGRRVVGAA